ncbi:MAG: acyl carrier protein [Bacteroidales bacterium]|nr:acyl carrier protein [Bacteroidales bacterium]
MTNQEIFSILGEILLKVKPNTDMSKVSMDSSLVMDLGIDSLSMLLICLAMEQQFNMQFQTMQQFNTVADIVEYVSSKVNG